MYEHTNALLCVEVLFTVMASYTYRNKLSVRLGFFKHSINIHYCANCNILDKRD